MAQSSQIVVGLVLAVFVAWLQGRPSTGILPLRVWPGSHPVPTWRINSSTFMADVEAKSQPVVLRDLPSVAPWPAFTKWNDRRYLSRHLDQVTVHVPRSPTVQLHSRVQPFGSLPGVIWTRPWTQRNITVEEFTSARRHLYYAMIPGRNLPVAMKRDIGGLAGLVNRNIVEVNVWLTKAPVSTPTHYDVTHNTYVQVSGRKRFILFPPESYAGLYLYPRLHPSTRQSQASFRLDPSRERVARVDTDMFPSAASLQAYEVVLEPGDALFIPSYWFHHVMAEGDDASVSLSVCWESTGLRSRQALYDVPAPPVPLHWPPARRVAVLIGFVNAIVPHEIDITALITNVLATRYLPLEFDDQAPGLWDQIKPRPSLPCECGPPMPRSVLSVSNRVNGVAFPSAAQRHIEIANYIEDVVGDALGPDLVASFLQLFVRQSNNPNPCCP